MGIYWFRKNSVASPDETEDVPIGLVLLVLYLLTLFQSEHDGHTVSATDILALVLGRNPFRHLLQYAQCFIRQKWVGRFHYLEVGQTAVFLYDKSDKNPAFDAFLFSLLGIMHLTCNEHITFCHVTWIGRHHFGGVVNSSVLWYSQYMLYGSADYTIRIDDGSHGDTRNQSHKDEHNQMAQVEEAAAQFGTQVLRTLEMVLRTVPTVMPRTSAISSTVSPSS